MTTGPFASELGEYLVVRVDGRLAQPF
jgi:hypothetical protein